eukprot:gene5983-12063_t
MTYAATTITVLFKVALAYVLPEIKVPNSAKIIPPRFVIHWYDDVDSPQLNMNLFRGQHLAYVKIGQARVRYRVPTPAVEETSTTTAGDTDRTSTTTAIMATAALGDDPISSFTMVGPNGRAIRPPTQTATMTRHNATSHSNHTSEQQQQADKKEAEEYSADLTAREGQRKERDGREKLLLVIDTDYQLARADLQQSELKLAEIKDGPPPLALVAKRQKDADGVERIRTLRTETVAALPNTTPEGVGTGHSNIQTRGKTRQGVLEWADNIKHIAPKTERKPTTGLTTPGQPKIYLVQTSMFQRLDGSGANPPITSYMGTLPEIRKFYNTKTSNALHHTPPGETELTTISGTLKIILRHVQLRDHTIKELKTLKNYLRQTRRMLRELKREKGINKTPQHKDYALQIRLTMDRITYIEPDQSYSIATVQSIPVTGETTPTMHNVHTHDGPREVDVFLLDLDRGYYVFWLVIREGVDLTSLSGWSFPIQREIGQQENSAFHGVQ